MAKMKVSGVVPIRARYDTRREDFDKELSLEPLNYTAEHDGKLLELVVEEHHHVAIRQLSPGFGELRCAIECEGAVLRGVGFVELLTLQRGPKEGQHVGGCLYYQSGLGTGELVASDYPADDHHHYRYVLGVDIPDHGRFSHDPRIYNEGADGGGTGPDCALHVRMKRDPEARRPFSFAKLSESGGRYQVAENGDIHIKELFGSILYLHFHLEDKSATFYGVGASLADVYYAAGKCSNDGCFSIAQDPRQDGKLHLVDHDPGNGKTYHFRIAAERPDGTSCYLLCTWKNFGGVEGAGDGAG